MSIARDGEGTLERIFLDGKQLGWSVGGLFHTAEWQFSMDWLG